MEKEIIIKPNFVFKDYFKVYLYLYWNRPFFKIISTVVLLIIIFNVLTSLKNDFELNELFNSSFIFILSFPLIIIYSVYRYTKKVLASPKLKENISISFNENYMEDIGESFKMKYYWKDIKKIVEKKDWFLIYVEKNLAKVIRKEDLKDYQYKELKQLFNSIDIKKSLKD